MLTHCNGENSDEPTVKAGGQIKSKSAVVTIWLWPEFIYPRERIPALTSPTGILRIAHCRYQGEIFIKRESAYFYFTRLTVNR